MASRLVQENASPEGLGDLEDFLGRIVPEGPGRYRHDDEEPDDIPAHIRAALTQTPRSIPVEDGRTVIGTWQGIVLQEHRSRAQRHEVVLHLIGNQAAR